MVASTRPFTSNFFLRSLLNSSSHIKPRHARSQWWAQLQDSVTFFFKFLAYQVLESILQTWTYLKSSKISIICFKSQESNIMLLPDNYTTLLFVTVISNIAIIFINHNKIYSKWKVDFKRTWKNKRTRDIPRGVN